MDNFDIVKMANDILRSSLPPCEDEIVRQGFESALKSCDEAIKNIVKLKLTLIEGYEEWKKTHSV